MSTRAHQGWTLAIIAGIGLSSQATARAGRDRPEYRRDGTVRVGTQQFPSRAAYYASSTFLDSGARCGSVAPAAVELAPGDCSLTNTTISSAYDDNRTLVIQVVFHVIKKTDGTGDISPALIQSQLDILNEDFNAIAGTPGAAGHDAKVQFVLARFDPSGQPTTGIAVVTNDSYFEDPGSGGGPNPMKTALRWDPTRYLNIYTNDANGLLGYATFPQGSAGSSQDGVVVLWDTVGRNSPAGPPYNLGRTVTHEVGHYLGLFHTFQGGCTGTRPYNSGDLIADTNRESQPHGHGCTAAESCSGAGPDPIDNYMDYSDDECMTKFSVEQTNRVRCAIVNYRTVNTAPTAAFTYSSSETVVSFTNTSTDAESTVAALKTRWMFGDGATSTDANPMHGYAADGTYQVTLEVVDPGSGTATTTQAVVVVTAANMPDAGNTAGPDAGNPDGNGPGGGSSDDGGCCHAPNGDTSFVLCAIPVVLVWRRRRRC